MYVTDEFRKALDTIRDARLQLQKTQKALERAGYNDYPGEQRLFDDLQYADDDLYELNLSLSDSYNDLLFYEGQDGMISFSKRRG